MLPKDPLATPTDKWTLEKIVALGEESSRLDYKDSRKLKDNLDDELSKTTSAFSNCNGGVIVFGVKDPKITNGVPTTDGGFQTSYKGGTREWLEDKMANTVDPRIEEVIVSEVKDTSLGSDMALYVIEVKEGKGDPHQANDCKYYKRLGTKNTPMTHSEIEALKQSRRKESASSSIYISIKDMGARIRCNIRLQNTGKALISTFKLEVRLPFVINGIGCVSSSDSKGYVDEQKHAWLQFELTRPNKLHLEESTNWVFDLEHEGSISFDNGVSCGPADKAVISLWVNGLAPKKGELTLGPLPDNKGIGGDLILDFNNLSN